MPQNANEFNNTTLLLSGFAAFENSINNIKQIQFSYPYNYKYNDAKIYFPSSTSTNVVGVNGKSSNKRITQPQAVKTNNGCLIPRFAVIYFGAAPIGIHWLHNICTGENTFQFFYPVNMTAEGDESSSSGGGNTSGSYKGGLFIGGSALYTYAGYDPTSNTANIYQTGGSQIYPSGDPIPAGTDDDPAWGVVQVPQVDNPYAEYQVFSAKSAIYDDVIIDESTDTTGTDYNDYGTFDDATQAWPTVSSIFSKAEFIGFYYPGITKQCFDYAKAQMALKGFASAPRNTPGQYWQLLDSNNTVFPSVARQAVAYINGALQQGTPVLVGVQYHTGIHPSNEDKATDHFIVIVGSGVDAMGRKYYLFFDNAANYKLAAEGASDQNRLYWDETNGTLQGATKATYSDNQTKFYKLTQVRKTRKP